MRHARISWSAAERIDLLKAWAATSIAFGVYFLAGTPMRSFSLFASSVLLAAITAGIGFIAHEVCHKLAAHHFGVQAEFRSNDKMLLVSIIVAFLGVIIAAPGAVHILGGITRRENGIISAAGPFANVVLALLFLPLIFLGGIGSLVGAMGLLVNAILAAFNMIPLFNLDGEKILHWNKAAYFSLLVIAGLLVAVAFSMQ